MPFKKPIGTGRMEGGGGMTDEETEFLRACALRQKLTVFSTGNVRLTDPSHIPAVLGTGK